MSGGEIPSEFDTASIVDGHDLYFDAGDKLNGSLYLCTPRAGEVGAAPWIGVLHEAGLWSDEPPKQVGDDQRQAYKDGLTFVAAVAYRVSGGHLLLARFDHPKFPSDARRWQAWVDCLDARCERAG